MLILIDNKSGVPIYEQIFTQIKGHILSGELKSDEPLPSIRGLAKDLRISVITTKRAYDELERAGYLYTVPGKGSFVCGNADGRSRETQQLLGTFDDTAAALLSLGVSREELIARLQQEE